MNSSNDYERIALSKQDLKFVYSQILNKTNSKLDLHLPEKNNDPMKNKIANILDEFVMGGFELLKSALIVDGRDMSHSANKNMSISEILSLRPKEKVEDFDASINAKLRDVLLRVEEETTEVTKCRRELPFKAKQAYEDLVSQTDKEVSSLIAEIESSYDLIDEDDEAVSGIENITEITDEYSQHVLSLNELKKSIPVRKAELHRLQDTIKFLELAYEKQRDELN